MSPAAAQAPMSAAAAQAPAGGAARAALADRLRTVAPWFGIDPPAATSDPSLDAAALLPRLVDAVAGELSNDRVWLLLTAIAAEYPTRDDVDEARREFELDRTGGSADELCLFLLDSCLQRAGIAGTAAAPVRVVDGGVVVDVDHSAKFKLHTGIQQVTRNLLPRWHLRHGVVPAAWTAGFRCLQLLTDLQTRRILDWGAPGTAEDDDRSQVGATGRLLIPWRSVVVLAEVPPMDATDRLAAIGAYSGNRVVAIAYDAIPIASADMVPLVESGKFARYLAAIKFADRVAGISAAATAEIAGFVAALPTQGLRGPTVVEVALPVLPATARTEAITSGPPMILVVGSHEPRKNHLAVLHAAETLWQQGVPFTLQFIGGSGWGEAFPQRAAELTGKGRSLQVLRAVDDDTLQRAFDAAAFTVFPSLHEGYGLPVAESFAHRTPVITSDFGSTAEIAGGGGALLVDPRDDDALIEAMRTLLTDGVVRDRLVAEIDRRRPRTWIDYADQLWTELVAPAIIRTAPSNERSGVRP